MITPRPTYSRISSVEDYLKHMLDRRFSMTLVHRDLLDLFNTAPGSGHNHQAWPGGYRDHLTQGLSLGERLYATLTQMHGPPPFTFDSFVVAWYFHDVEKLYRDAASPLDKPLYLTRTLPEVYQLQLTPDELNAIEYAHGEGDAYRKDARVMGRLAGFLHAVDVISGRVLFDLKAEDAFK